MAADALFDQAASVLIDRGIDGGIDCAIVLGTGLGRIIDDMVDPVSIPFEEIPGFPKGSVSGHATHPLYTRAARPTGMRKPYFEFHATPRRWSTVHDLHRLRRPKSTERCVDVD